MAVWKIKKSVERSLTREEEKNYHPIVLELLEKRGLVTKGNIESFFQFNYEKDLTDPFDVIGMEKAVDRIANAREKEEKIAIYGDYDADGVTATAVLYETLSNLGFSNVTYYIPDRQLEGYGINEKSVEYLYQQGVKLIITVDCGITNFKEIEKAKELGIDVIITDHHHVMEEIPAALVVINPHMPNSGFRFQHLAGVGVAFKLAQALYQKFDPEKIDQLKWALDLVCIGTVADCVPLLGENRVLTRYGLIVVSKTRRVGLQEMFRVGRINIDENHIPNAYEIAFFIAPRINAAGRVDHASMSYNLLIEKDRVVARDLALEVEGKNQERQKVTGQIVKEVTMLAQNAFKDKKFIIASNLHWPVGILGLVAGKISDQFNKPTVVCQKQDDFFVGSLRSIPEVNIVEVLEECSTVLDKFGGHAQAAGIRVKKEQMAKFYELFEEAINKRVTEEETIPEIEVDTEITAADINWELMEELKKMEPFGEGNPQPVFLMNNLVVVEIRIVGNGSKHLKLALRPQNGSPKIFDAIGFSLGEQWANLKNNDIIDIVFTLEEDSWNGNKKLQLKLMDLRRVN